jgi:hypothetical protein
VQGQLRQLRHAGGTKMKIALITNFHSCFYNLIGEVVESDRQSVRILFEPNPLLKENRPMRFSYWEVECC